MVQNFTHFYIFKFFERDRLFSLKHVRYIALLISYFLVGTTMQGQGVYVSGNIDLSSGAHDAGFQTSNTTDAAAVLSNGNYVAAWETRDGIDGDGDGGFFRVFSATGTAVTGVIMPYADINAAGTGDQGQGAPKVVALNTGFVVVWESEQGPGDNGPGGTANDDQDIYHRIYDNSGTAVSATIKTNAGNDIEEEQLHFVLPLSNGGFSVLYSRDEDDTGNNDDYFIRAFNSMGVAASANVNISSGAHDAGFQTSNTTNAMAELSNGNFVVGWETRDGIDGDGDGGFFRVFSATGTAVTGVIMPYADINAAGTGDQGQGAPKVVALNTGFVVAWESEQGPGDNGPGGTANDDQDIYHRIYDNSGTAVSVTIKTNAGNDIEEEQLHFVLPLSNGGFSVLYSRDEDDTGNNDDYFIRAFNSMGVAASANVNISSGAHDAGFQTSNTTNAMAELSNGNFVVGWETRDGIDGDGDGGFFRVFSATGTAVTGVIRPYADINAAGTGDQGQGAPKVVALNTGFIVAWESEQGPGDNGPGGTANDDQDIYHRFYDNSGTAASATIKTNAGNDAEEEQLQDIRALNSGNFVLMYSDDEDDTGNKDDFFIRVLGLAAADTTPPVITCPADLTVACDASTAPADTGTATATDDTDPSPVITFVDVVSGVTGNNSTITRTWTATDASMNASSCDQIITVTDTTGPVITCPAGLTVECDASTAPADTGMATATDNCDMAPAITFVDVVSGVTGNNSTITRTWTATDVNGNANTCDQVITVTDTTGPVITCPADLTVECDASTAPADTGMATATDNCDMAPAITFVDVVSGVTGNNSTITRTWTATDVNGNANTCDQVITVTDTTGPVITCPADLTVECDASTAPADTGMATATDNCDMAPAITFVDVVSGVTGNNSTITRTWTATDVNGNANTCDQVITVTDTTGPVITCPADLTVECDASTAPADTGMATATDNCDMAPAITFVDVVSGVTGNNSTITRTWTATDVNGNANTCDQVITVTDTTGPVITCPADLTVECDASTAPADTGMATATDNCDMAPAITFVDVVSGVTGNNSTITRTWTATDVNGNANTCDQVITVTDTTGPVITCPADLTVECDASTAPADTGMATATDNCDMAPAITFVDVVSGVTGNNSTITRTWTATDVNGNANTCDQVITVTDTTGPVITCPADLTVECDASTAPADTGMATATDNCDMAPAITFVDVVSGVTGNNSTITRTWTATDVNGNANTCDQVITVTDTTGPVITCPADLTVECDASTAPADTGMATATDNCDGAPVITSTDVVVAGVGNNSVITRTWTATDVNGNANTCDQVITVTDTTGPVITCPADLTVECDASTAPADTGMATATDNCDGAPVITSTDVVVAGVGNNSVITRTWTATDVNGNANTCDQIITVVDTTAPVVTMGPIDIFTGTGANNDSCSTIVNYDPVTIDSFVLTDNCDDPSDLTVVQTGGLGSGASFPVGVTIEEYTITDSNGNEVIYTFEITITDTTDPVIDCPDDLIVSDGGTGIYTIEDYSALVSDNCSSGVDLVITQDPVAGTEVAALSTTTVTLTATDAAGNITICTFDILVDGSLSIDDTILDDKYIRLYPNPTEGILSFDTRNVVIEEVQVFDIRGRLVKSTQFSPSVFSMDISDLEAALYILRVHTERGVVTKRILKK